MSWHLIHNTNIFTYLNRLLMHDRSCTLTHKQLSFILQISNIQLAQPLHNTIQNVVTTRYSIHQFKLHVYYYMINVHIHSVPIYGMGLVHIR